MTAILFVDFCRGSVSVRRCSFVCEMRVGDDRERRWSEERHGYDVQIQRFALQKCIGVSKIRLKVKLIFLYRKSLLKKKKLYVFCIKKLACKMFSVRNETCFRKVLTVVASLETLTIFYFPHSFLAGDMSRSVMYLLRKTNK